MTAPSTAPPARGGALDLLRFAAAAFVVIYHMGDDAPVALETISPVLDRGYLATDFFLLLSGYVVARAYGDQVLQGAMSVAAFLWKRLSRLWPQHAIVLAGFAALILLATLGGLYPRHAERFQLQEFWLQLTLTHAWGLPNAGGWNVPTWTLSALIPCYALFVLLWRWIVARTWWVGLIAAFVGLATVDAVSVSLLGRTINHLPEYLGVLRAVPIFIVGMTLARARAPLSRLKLAPPLLLLAGAGLLIASQIGTPLEMLSMLATGLLILGGEAVSRFSSAFIARLAKWAFPLFLVHTPTLAVWSVAYRAISEGGSTAVDWVAWSVGFALSLLVAAGFSTWIDEPLARRARRPRAPELPALPAVGDAATPQP